jgi:hypothetical protein
MAWTSRREHARAFKCVRDPRHMDRFFLVATNGLEQILSPSIPTKGDHSPPTLRNPRHERFLLRSWQPARAPMRLMSWLDIEQTAVMRLG